MDKRRWITLVIVVALIAIAATVGPALAHGPQGETEEDGDAPWGYGHGMHGGMGMHGGLHMAHGGMHGLDRVAETLGLTTDELLERLADGATIEELAAQAGVSLDALVGAWLEPHGDMLRQHVEAGDITPQEAEAMLEEMAEHIEEAIISGGAGYLGMPCKGEGFGFEGHGTWDSEHDDTRSFRGGRGHMGGGMMGGGMMGGGMMGTW